MTHKFNIDDHVIWNSLRGYTSGKIINIHTKDITYKGRTYHASEDEPKYEVQSDKSGKIALHKGSALRRKNNK